VCILQRGHNSLIVHVVQGLLDPLVEAGLRSLHENLLGDFSFALYQQRK